MNEFFLIAGMALVTFATRYPVLAVVSRIPLPEPIFKALKFVPPVVLTAIIVPAVLLPEGSLSLQFSNAALYAGVIAALISWRSRNLLLTIVGGMLAFWGWRYVVGLISL